MRPSIEAWIRIGTDTDGHSRMSQDIEALQTALREFATARDWEQFHSPKNLASALAVESAELLEHFQWITEDQSRNLAPEKRAEVSEELADVLLYLLQLADKLGVAPLDAAWAKLRVNASKYPADRARGRSTKYTEL